MYGLTSRVRAILTQRVGLSHHTNVTSVFQRLYTGTPLDRLQIFVKEYAVCMSFLSREGLHLVA